MHTHQQPSKILFFQNQPFRLRKSVLKIGSKFIGEHPCRSAISINLLCSFIEVALQHGRSPVNFMHIFRPPFYKNTSGGLLLFFALFFVRTIFDLTLLCLVSPKMLYILKQTWQTSTAVLFKYVWPFSGHHGLKSELHSNSRMVIACSCTQLILHKIMWKYIT